MIYSVSCDTSSFRKVEFQPGFNVILADRAEESGQKESRNGLGKSTLIEIIHFCLGGKRGKTLQKKELNGWSFTLELDIKGKRIHVTRNTEKTSNIIVEGDTSDWPIMPSPDKKTGQPVIGYKDWRNLLGVLLFGLETADTDFKYAPTFRSLISYFVRRNGQSGGFLKPSQQFEKQREWDVQVNNAYLLSIGWEYASRLQVLRDRKNVLAQIKQEAQSGLLSGLLGSIGELEALQITKESQAKQEEEQLASFRVYPQYEQIENDANDLTQKIHEIVNKNIVDKRLLEHYEASLEDEAEAKPEAIQKVYLEAGITLPKLVTKRLDDVISFHKQVVANRRDFLRTEIERLKNAIVRREQEKQTLTLKRAELMKVLEQHGALKEYTVLQTRHQGTIAELKDLGIRIENLKKFEQGKSSIVIEKQLLHQEANRDLSERKVQKEKAVLLFNSNSKALYEAPGTLSIDVTENGFKFNVSIKRSGSHGISNMEIFCYDLMLAQLWVDKETSPGFLIHDSILFADVDERQRAFALQLAAKETEKRSFQYICLINSDNIPMKDFDPSFKFEQYVRQRFTDARLDGGLLGIRF